MCGKRQNSSYQMTPRENKTELTKVDLNSIPSWSKKEVAEGFNLVRDHKYLPCSNLVDNKRAIPWLYPENGCFVKAALARKLLSLKGYPNIKKLFVFGDFKYKSKWTETGYVSFKFHVAVATRVESDVYILDPSVEYEKPLLLLDWCEVLTSESENKRVEYSLCSDMTVSHNSECDEIEESNEIGIRRDIPHTMEFFAMEFLAKEYENIHQLGLNPNLVLSVEPHNKS